MKYLWKLILSCIICLYSCNNQAPTSNHEEIVHELNNEKENSTSKEVEAILSSIPSSSEITATIKASGAPYSGLMINNPSFIDNYNTNYRKAINLGIYGTDLGYIGIYDKSSVIMEHLKVINQLATDIDLVHLLRSEEIKKMIDQGRLSDSVFEISSEVFEDMCLYLQSNERHEIGVLMLLGGWLEAIHIATSVAYNSETENPNLNKKIAEQKVVLNKFIEVLEKYENEQFFKQLLVDLINLKKIYNEIQYETADSVIKDTSIVVIPESKAEITDVQLAQITIQLEKIRSSIINPL